MSDPTGAGPIETVVLDLGNVMVEWDPRVVWSRTMSEDEIEAFLQESGFEELNRSLDAGRGYEEARAELAQRHPHHVAALDAYWEAFADTLVRPVPGMAELVAALGAGGTRLVGLSNWSAETFHHAAVAAPAIELLEDVLVSGHVRLIKPDPAIFALLISRFDLDPARSLFVDDSPANVEAAREFGLHAHLFRGVEGLRAELLARGVPLAS